MYGKVMEIPMRQFYVMFLTAIVTEICLFKLVISAAGFGLMNVMHTRFWVYVG